MGNLKNILLQCQENEKVFAKHNVVSRDRDRNLGWIECCKFFFNNFELTEKTINKERE